MPETQQRSWTQDHGTFVAIDWFGGEIYYAMTAMGELYRFCTKEHGFQYVASFPDADRNHRPENRGYFAALSARGSGFVRAITSRGYVYTCNPSTGIVSREQFEAPGTTEDRIPG